MANSQWLTGTQVGSGGNLNTSGDIIASLGSGSGSLQGGSGVQQTGSVQTTGQVQTPYNPNNLTDPVAEDPSLVSTNYDPYAAAAAAQAAAEAARLGTLRGDTTRLANNIKDIFNARYGLVDTAAREQADNLNKRYTTESGQLATDIGNEVNKTGAAFGGRGTFDSSDRGNTQDEITREGQKQITSLGEELSTNLAGVGKWATGQKSNFDVEKANADSIISRIAQSTDATELENLKASLESRINELNAGAADYNTNEQNRASLESIAPSSQRAVQLKTTLSQIVGGNADPSTKLAIGTKIVQNSGLTPAEQEQLIMAFQSDLSGTTQKDQTQQ